jgi:anti-sigma regulatory factor (Ser/Thr protein kinase)
VDPDRLRTVRESIVLHAVERGLPQERAWDMAAAADELLCNIDEHAGAAWIEISLEQEGERTLMRVNDDGREFDVASAISGIQAPNNHRERGLGLFVVKSVTHSVKHRRLEDGANETLLSF